MDFSNKIPFHKRKSMTEILATGIKHKGGLAQFADAEQQAERRKSATSTSGSSAQLSEVDPPCVLTVEGYLNDSVKRMGGECVKWEPEGWTNRIVLLPDSRVGFLELKSRGEKPTGLQRSRLRTLERLGMMAGWANDFYGVQRFLCRFSPPLIDPEEAFAPGHGDD
jgi:hypothetical protein